MGVYDFGQKRHYRRIVWKEFADFFGPNRASKKVVLLPHDLAEVEVALGRGFHQGNLFVVNRNPARVAHVKRHYPLVNTYGVDLHRALYRMFEKDLDGANYDLMNACGHPLWQTLSEGLMNPPMAEHCILAVTVLRGRERPQVHKWIDFLGRIIYSKPNSFAPPKSLAHLHRTDLGRILFVEIALDSQAYYKLDAQSGDGMADHFKPFWQMHCVRAESYRSTAGHQTMLWMIFQAHYYDDRCEHCSPEQVLWGAYRHVFLRQWMLDATSRNSTLKLTRETPIKVLERFARHGHLEAGLALEIAKQ